MKLNIDFIYPIGSIYMTVSSTNPQVLFGGTWTRVANGRCLVGVDTLQSEFDRVEKTGGEKTHQLTIEEIPSRFPDFRGVADGNFTMPYTTGSGNFAIDIRTADRPHNNLQPYYCVYIWKRTA